MRVVICTPWAGTFAGGATRALLDTAKILKGYGAEVEIFTTKSESPFKAWATHQDLPDVDTVDGLPVRRFAVRKDGVDAYHAVNAKLSSNAPISGADQDEFFSLGLSSPDLYAAIAGLDPEVRIICGPYYQALAHGIVEAAPGRVVVMSAFHDEAPFYWTPVKRLIKNAKALMFLTEEEKDLTQRAHGDVMDRAKTEAPVTGLCVPVPDRIPAFEGGPPRLLYIGRLDRGKGLPLLLDWHRLLNTRRATNGLPPIVLSITGDGERGLLDGYDVDYRGFVSEDEKNALLRQSLALVNLSGNESFSYVVMEAWAQGCPVIVNGACEVLDGHIHRSSGGKAVLGYDDFEQACAALAAPDVRTKVGADGYAYVAETCGKDTFINKLITLLN
jgi:glycosyltransferase involved in cell wall biosynthesis